VTRLARAERRRFASEGAATQRRRASTELGQVVAQLEPFGLQPSIDERKRVRHLRLRLDTVLAIQMLAEESLLQGSYDDVQQWLEREAALVLSLREALADPALRRALGDDHADLTEQVERCAKQAAFLRGRLLVQQDPSFTSPALVRTVIGHFTAARGADDELNCRIDLSLGDLLLTAALAGKGDASTYDEAVAALERATTRQAPGLRAVAVRALSEAYARRPAAMRRLREAARSAKAS
jgi:hypothetical protein